MRSAMRIVKRKMKLKEKKEKKRRSLLSTTSTSTHPPGTKLIPTPIRSMCWLHLEAKLQENSKIANQDQN